MYLFDVFYSNFDSIDYIYEEIYIVYFKIIINKYMLGS